METEKHDQDPTIRKHIQEDTGQCGEAWNVKQLEVTSNLHIYEQIRKINMHEWKQLWYWSLTVSGKREITIKLQPGENIF